MVGKASRREYSGPSSGASKWVRVPIVRPKGGRLRVIIYCRISTDEQRQQSLIDQERFCRRFLQEVGLRDEDVEIVVILDNGISGEIIFRPGIDSAFARVKARQVDLVLTEEASRLYRNEQAAFQFVGTAVDLGVRVICINDFVDTAEEDVWPQRLHDAMRQHGRANDFTRWRIKRTLQGLWEMGAAIGMLKPGYRRQPSVPATDRDPAEGPFYDEIDRQWSTVILEAFTRITAQEPPWLVGDWLTLQGLPRRTNAKSEKWDDKGVIELIRDPIYRGHDVYRETVNKKEYTTGKSKQVRNDPDQVLRRDMPHLRIVDDHLWYAANAAIDDRITTRNRRRGLDHPLSGIPRDSRGPLSNLLVCGRCPGKMYATGPNGYRCANSEQHLQTDHPCWNRATARSENVHQAIADGIRAHRARLTENLVAGLDWLRQLLLDPERVAASRQELETTIQTSTKARDNLLLLAEQAAEPPEVLLERLAQLEEAIARARAELEYLAEQDVRLTFPTAEETISRIGQIADRLAQGDRLIRSDLEPLIGKIRAIPHQQFGSNKVVLRARFELNPLGLLSPAVRFALQTHLGDELFVRLPDVLKPVPVNVNLFIPSAGPAYFEQALALNEQGLGPTAIGEALHISKRNACIAIDFGKRLRNAGLLDPFIELHEPPAKASRWRKRAAKAPEVTASGDRGASLASD